MKTEEAVERERIPLLLKKITRDLGGVTGEVTLFGQRRRSEGTGVECGGIPRRRRSWPVGLRVESRAGDDEASTESGERQGRGDGTDVVEAGAGFDRRRPNPSAEDPKQGRRSCGGFGVYSGDSLSATRGETGAVVVAGGGGGGKRGGGSVGRGRRSAGAQKRGRRCGFSGESKACGWSQGGLPAPGKKGKPASMWGMTVASAIDGGGGAAGLFAERWRVRRGRTRGRERRGAGVVARWRWERGRGRRFGGSSGERETGSQEGL